MSLLEFVRRYSTTEACIRHIESVRWRAGAYCPRCHHRHIYHYADGRRHRCADCKLQFRITTGTMFSESPLKLLPKWFAAIYLVTEHRKGVSSVQLVRDIGVTQKTAWHMMHRIHNAAGVAFQDGKLQGAVEIDEAYFGGETSRKAKGKCIDRRGYGEDDSILLGMKERGGKVRTYQIGQPTTKVVTPIIHSALQPGTRIYTDNSSLYLRAGQDFKRESVIHMKGEYARGEVHTQGIEGFWATLRRAYHGVHHWWSRKTASVTQTLQRSGRMCDCSMGRHESLY